MEKGQRHIMNKQSYESLIEQDLDKVVTRFMPHGGGATITETALRLAMQTFAHQVASHTRSYELLNLMDTEGLADYWHVSRPRVIKHITHLHERWGVGRKVGRDWLLSTDEAERHRPGPVGRPRKQPN